MRERRPLTTHREGLQRSPVTLRVRQTILTVWVPQTTQSMC
jgi:hypothetical protein